MSDLNTDVPGLKLVIVSRPDCVQCNATYRALDKKGLPYATVNSAENADFKARAAVLNYMSAPVGLLYRDGVMIDHWAGFDPGKISNAAQLFAAEGPAEELLAA